MSSFISLTQNKFKSQMQLFGFTDLVPILSERFLHLMIIHDIKRP